MSNKPCDGGCCAGSNKMHTQDPCRFSGSTQWFALLWFISIVLFGTAFTATLATVDRNEYQSRGAFLDRFDFKAIRANRLGATGIASEYTDARLRRASDDARQRGDLSTNRKMLQLSLGQSADH